MYSERWGKARDHEAFSFFRILVFLWQSALLNVQDTEGSGFELGRTWDLLCSWCLLRWCPDVPLPFICYWLRLGGEVSTLHRQRCCEGILLPLRHGAYKAYMPSNALGAIGGERKNNFAHRTSYKRQSVRYWHETFDQPQSHLPNPSCIPHHLSPRPRSPQSQWHQLAMPIWLVFVPWQACESWPFGDATSAASTTAPALWLSVETRSQNVHTSWSFPTRLKTLDAYLVA